MSKSLPNQHILDSFPDFIWITDQHHQYIAGSEKSAKVLGFESKDKMVGSHMSDIPCNIDTEELCKQRDYVLSSKNTIEVLDIHPYADGKLQVHNAKRSPYYDEAGKLIGVMTIARELNSKLFSKLVFSLIQSDKKYHALNNFNRSYELISGQIKHLSQRELECFFYLLRGYTAKEIGVALKISFRTVEIHINNLKIKMESTNKSNLIEKGLTMGLLNLAPINFVKDLTLVL